MTPYFERDGIRIYLGDSREILSGLPDESVDLVLTDPPYPAAFLPLYATLAQESARLLKPGGSLVTLCGHYQVPDVLDLIRPHLRYWWIGGLRHRTVQNLAGKWVGVAFKPALWFVKGGRRSGDTACPTDMLDDRYGDKRFHHWGQNEHWFAHWIATMCPADGMVLDPFLGGGTTTAAAYKLGRRCVGIDNIEANCETAARRLSQMVLPLGAA